MALWTTVVLQNLMNLPFYPTIPQSSKLDMKWCQQDRSKPRMLSSPEKCMGSFVPQIPQTMKLNKLEKSPICTVSKQSNYEVNFLPLDTWEKFPVKDNKCYLWFLIKVALRYNEVIKIPQYCYQNIKSQNR